jgi:lauroyl/myristoyl acyltransferase
MVAIARELVCLGDGAFSGPKTDEFVAEVGRRHPARELYTRSTAEAIARCGLQEDCDAVAGEVFSNFVWTHFVSKLLMAAAPAVTASFVAENFNLSAVEAALEAAGPSLLSCFHYSGYPLVALALAMSAEAPLISKARVDVLDRSGGAASGHVVHISNRSAAVRLTRALRSGRSVWVSLDVVLPSVRVVRTRFLGHGMNVGAGMGKIARLSGSPCVPVFWSLRNGQTRLQTAPPLSPDREVEEGIIHAFVSTQAEFIKRHPTQWLEWYSVLDEAPGLREEVKRGNDAVWERLSEALV